MHVRDTATTFTSRPCPRVISFCSTRHQNMLTSLRSRQFDGLPGWRQLHLLLAAPDLDLHVLRALLQRVGGAVVAGVSEQSAKSKTPHPTQLERALLSPGQVSMNRVVSRLLVLN